MPLGTFARLTFGSRTFLPRSLAGLIDYRHWGQDFTTSTPNSDFTFDQALHNMDPREFRDLLFTEDLHEQSVPTVYSWSKGTFRPKTFKPMTFRGVQTLSRRSRLTGGSSIPATLEKWRSAVADMLDRQQAQITMDMFKPEGVMTMLLVAPNGSLLDLPNDTAYRAIHDILAILEDRFKADRSKFLTTQTKANIAARDGYSAATPDSNQHYAYLFGTADDPDTDARLSPTTGRLVAGSDGVAASTSFWWRAHDFGADYRLGTTSVLETMQGRPLDVKTKLNAYPSGSRAAFSQNDIFPKANSYQRLNIKHESDPLTGNFQLTYFRANPVRRTDKTGNSGTTVVDSDAHFQTDGVVAGMRFRRATTQSTDSIADLIANHSSRIDSVDSETQLTLEDSGVTGDSLHYVIERVTEATGNTSTKLLDANGNFNAMGVGVAVGDYIMNVATLAKWKITAVVSATELTLETGAANADDLSYVIGRTTAEIDASQPVQSSASGGSQDQLLYLVYDALASLVNAPPLAVYPKTGTDTEKELQIYFFDSRKSADIWPFGDMDAPLAQHPPGYYSPEVSVEYALLATKPAPAAGGCNGELTVTPTAENLSSQAPTGPTETTILYQDFLSDQFGPLLDDSGTSPSWRTLQAIKMSNWRDWFYRFMERWWAEYEDIGGDINHVYNDNERIPGYQSSVRSSLRRVGLLTSPGRAQAARFLTKMPYFGSTWAPRLPDVLVTQLKSGTVLDFGSSADTTTVREDQRLIASFDAVGHMVQAEYMYYSVYQSCAEHFPDVTAGGGWLDRLRSLSLIAADGAEDRIHTFGTTHGTHQGVRMYSAGDRVAEMDRHFYNLPPFAEERTWVPQISAKIKNIRRDYVSAEDHYLTTVEVFNAEDVDVTPPNSVNNARRGNDQFLNGLKVGHLVHMRDNGGKGLSEDNENALLDFEPTTLSKYAVTAVGHVDGSGNFQNTPDGDGNYVACQYIDTDHASEPEYTDLDVGQLNAGLWLDTTTGWMNFVYNLRAYRSMFLASPLPISCWHGSEASGYWRAQQREYRLEVMFHGLLHGEQHRYWYNPNLEDIRVVDDPDDDDEALKDMEGLTNNGLLEMGAVCGVDVSDISPLSLNYIRPSMRYTDHIVSGANIGDDKRLFRITLKDEELVTLDENNRPVVRLYDQLIGPIQTLGTDHADFRTFAGHIVRVPGQLVALNPPIQFETYGRWVLCEKPS